MTSESQRKPSPTEKSTEAEQGAENRADGQKAADDREQELKAPQRISHVERVLEDSFPASDPPSWSPTTAGGPSGEDED